MTPCTRSDNWVRRFIVSDPRKHNRGFTIYKVTSILFPKGCPEAVTKVIVWKRYNDFKKLHHELQQKHKKLYLQGKFPPFAEAKFFRRFENEVIEERRKCATVLLEFIGSHPPLFTSNAFVKFFEGGYNEEESNELVISVEEKTNSLPYPATCKQKALSPNNTSKEPTIHTRNDGNGSLLTLGGTWQHPKVSDSISLSSHSSEEAVSSADTVSVLRVPRTSTQNSQKFSQNNTQLSGQSLLDVCSENIPSSVTTPDVPSQDYIVEANLLVTRANQHLASGGYDVAFSLLKQGISQLLTGVQDDMDVSRRLTVRRQAYEYLATAEKLYNEHLAPRFLTPLLPSNVQPQASPLPGLDSFKVLGVVGTVMLALNTKDDQCYIVKVLHKSPCPVNKSKIPILPCNVPYLIKLHFYFETDSAVFLFLQHASGGRLWDHVISYLQSQPPTPVHLMSRGNVYLGRKLIQEIKPRLVEEEPLDDYNDEDINDDMLQSAQNCSYAALIQNYREGRHIINTDAKSTKINGISTDSENLTEQKPEASIEGDISGKEDVIEDLEVSDSSRLGNSSENFQFTASIHNVDAKDVVHLETNELMRNAQELLRSVNETLLKTSGDHDDLNKTLDTGQNERSPPAKTKFYKKYLPLLRQSSGNRSSVEHRLSSDDLFEWRTSTSGGANMRQWERPTPRLPEIHVRQWAEQLVVCLAALHNSGLVFRDLHPENVLVSEVGHLLVTFTCVWPAVDYVISKQAVQNLYAAPEATTIFEVTPAADWWSLGAILYELITGKPLYLGQPGGVHSHSILHFPDFVSLEAQSLLTELLRYYPHERLGAGVGGVEEIKKHPFFAETNWAEVYKAGLKA